MRSLKRRSFAAIAACLALGMAAAAQAQQPYPGMPGGYPGGMPAQQAYPGAAGGGYPAQPQPYMPQQSYPGAVPGGMPGQQGYPGAGYAPQQPYPGAGAPGFAPQAGGFQPGGAMAPQQMQARLDQMMQEERRDLGVQPTGQLHEGAPHGPTPNQIPGGQVITTKGLVGLAQQQGIAYRVFDVLGASETLPGALNAVPASQGGSFQDQTQMQFGQFLAQVTQNNPDMPLIFYCAGVDCWMSYNASLRAIHLGYHNVLWYRGGLEAWKAVGLPTMQTAMMQQPQGIPGGIPGGGIPGGMPPQ